MGIPGSIGAFRISATRAAMPCAADHALLYGCENWKSFVPSIKITSASGEFISMRCAKPARPLRPV